MRTKGESPANGGVVCDVVVACVLGKCQVAKMRAERFELPTF